MHHKTVLQIFSKILPELAKQIDQHWPNGRNSVRIKLRNGTQVVFTVLERDLWRLESLHSFIRSIVEDISEPEKETKAVTWKG